MTKPANTASLKLSQPLDTASGPVAELTLRSPSAGELRGLKLAELLQGDAGAVIELLPRIAEPLLTPSEAAALSARDVVAVYTEIAGFFTGGRPGD